jgi:hypothetical protein
MFSAICGSAFRSTLTPGNEYMRSVQLVNSNPNLQSARLGHSREARFRYRICGLTAVTSVEGAFSASLLPTILPEPINPVQR